MNVHSVTDLSLQSRDLRLIKHDHTANKQMPSQNLNPGHSAPRRHSLSLQGTAWLLEKDRRGLFSSSSFCISLSLESTGIICWEAPCKNMSSLLAATSAGELFTTRGTLAPCFYQLQRKITNPLFSTPHPHPPYSLPGSPWSLRCLPIGALGSQFAKRLPFLSEGLCNAATCCSEREVPGSKLVFRRTPSPPSTWPVKVGEGVVKEAAWSSCYFPAVSLPVFYSCGF